MRSTSRTFVAVSISTIRRAEARIVSCEACDETAQTPFNVVLGSVRIRPPETIDYIMSEFATCPRCHGAVFEETLVELSGAGKERAGTEWNNAPPQKPPKG